MARVKKQVMVDYLANHYRYYTVNSWNKSTSYAQCVNINSFVPRELMDKAYEMLDVSEAYEGIKYILNAFAVRHDYEYQIGFNGRSSGYLVLIKGGYTVEKYFNKPNTQGRYYSDKMGWKSKEEAEAHPLFGMSYKKVYSQAGKGIDQYEDLTDWSYDELKERYNLIKDFDNTVEDCKKDFIELLKEFEVVEETIQVPKQIKVLKEVSNVSDKIK